MFYSIMAFRIWAKTPGTAGIMDLRIVTLIFLLIQCVVSGVEDSHRGLGGTLVPFPGINLHSPNGGTILTKFDCWKVG